jgi:hypothetical protein
MLTSSFEYLSTQVTEYSILKISGIEYSVTEHLEDIQPSVYQ